MAERAPCVGSEEVGVLMDLLSHDMLNNNQATLSYLELIHSSKVDQRTKDLAQRAVSQVRTSSMLLDSIRRFVSSNRMGVLPTAPVDLKDVLSQVAQDLSEMFPQKRVTVDTSGLAPDATARGAHCIQDLFGNLLMNLVQLDPGERVVIEVKSRPPERGGHDLLKVEVTALTAALPQGVGNEVFTHTQAKDVSKMARVSGAVFASSVARALGGGIKARVLDPEKNRGCVFEVSLKGGAA